MKNYEKIKEDMLDAARRIDESIYYTIEGIGLDINDYTDIPLSNRDIEAIEAIIYNEELSKEDIEAAMEAIDNTGDKLEKMNLYEKVDNIFTLLYKMQDCIEVEALDDYGEGDDVIQYIYKTADKWGLIYLWYRFIFKNAKKFLENKERG